MSSRRSGTSCASRSDHISRLLSLPDVALAHVCQYLDANSILNLRLTCKDLKDFVEQPTIFMIVPVTLHCSKQMQRMMDSGVLFNNFILNFRSIDLLVHFSAFSSQYGSTIRRLTVKTISNGYLKVLKLLEVTTCLEELELRELGLHVVKANEGIFEAVLNNFKNLQKLVIHRFVAPGLTGKEEIDFLLKLLCRCGKLKEFKIPLMDGYKAKMEYRRGRVSDFNRVPGPEIPIVLVPINFHEDEWWEPDEPDENENIRRDPIPEWDNKSERDEVLHGIIDLISRNRLTKLQRINLNSVPSFELKSLRDLILISEEKKISLLDIDSTQFAYLNSEIFPENEDHFKTFKSVAVMHSYRYFPLSKMTNLTDIHFQVGIGVDKISENVDFEFPFLKFFRIQYLGSVEDELFVRKLFTDHKRINMEKLHIDGSWELPKTAIIKDLETNFYNLREIIFNSWRVISDMDCIALWTSLHNLERVTLKDCSRLTNKAFSPPFNRLKKLKYLHIRDNSGKINEDVILHSIRWISLRSFIFSSTLYHSMNLQVYWSVAKSPLGRSVEHFDAPSPKARDFKFEKEIRKKFINLKGSLFD